MKTLQVWDKASGAMLAELVLPPLVPFSVGIEFGDNLARLLVIRSAYKGAVLDRVEIGNADIKTKITEKNF